MFAQQFLSQSSNCALKCKFNETLGCICTKLYENITASCIGLYKEKLSVSCVRQREREPKNVKDCLNLRFSIEFIGGIKKESDSKEKTTRIEIRPSITH